MIKPLCIALFCAFLHLKVTAQQKSRIVFYNCENLFDIYDDPLTKDDDRTPNGKFKWTEEKYQSKLHKITKVFKAMTLPNNNWPAVIGLCEIENAKVLSDLQNILLLKGVKYNIVHQDSPDQRGIDVALLYRPEVYTLLHYQFHNLYLNNPNNERKFTRDQLVVSGFLNEYLIHFIVVHWPSRSGGQKRSNPFRVKAAYKSRSLVDSLLSLDHENQIMIMGDFNDDPVNYSIQVLEHGKKFSDSLQNPMQILYKKGIGSIAHQDRWHLFDQILFTKNFLTPQRLRLKKIGVFNPKFMTQQKGPYRGYPLRSFSGISFTNGYSDHYPVYMDLAEPLPPRNPTQNEKKS